MNCERCRRMVMSLAIAGLLLTGLSIWLSNAPPTAHASPGALYVSPSGSAPDCTQSAPCDLQTALGKALDGDVIYLAQGTYTGTGGAVITVSKSITLYGGWDGSPTVPEVLSNTSPITGQDPLLDADYHLRLGSPAIDAGASLPWLTTDIDGDPRPIGTGYDIGVDEVYPHVFLPLVLRNFP